MNRILLFLVVCSCSFNSTYAQNNLSDYKYIIVPNRFDFFDEADKYRLNTLTKFLFKKYEFDALMADEPYPEDLQNDNCLALRANVINHKGLMKTKLEVELRDCSNSLVFSTKIGETRVKEYKKAYNLAMRDAFTSFQGTNYKYEGKSPVSLDVKPKPEMTITDVKPVKEVKEMKPKKQKKLVEISKEEKEDKAETLLNNQELLKANETTKKVIEKEFKKAEKIDKTINDNTFTAKEIFNGFKLLDNSLNEVMTIFDSGIKDVFIVKGKDAIIYKKGEAWVYSETNETNLLTKLIKIKF